LNLVQKSAKPLHNYRIKRSWWTIMYNFCHVAISFQTWNRCVNLTISREKSLRPRSTPYRLRSVVRFKKECRNTIINDIAIKYVNVTSLLTAHVIQLFHCHNYYL
jgi:hypothetical protein